MKQSLLLILLLVLLSFSCKQEVKVNIDDVKKSVAQAEADFAKMAADKGIAEAFWFYADSNAVIRRGNDSLIHGKEGIRNFYSAAFYKTASVSWSPDFVESSDDGKLAYTYGKYL